MSHFITVAGVTKVKTKRALNTIKCRDCGRFISEKSIDNGESVYESGLTECWYGGCPGYEKIDEWVCKKCSLKPKESFD